MYEFLADQGYGYALISDSKGQPKMIAVRESRERLARYDGEIYAMSDIAIICQMSVLLVCRHGRIISKRVTWDGCT